MILCICPSPALDVTYHLPRLEPGGTNRVRTVSHRPGGKALNVARVLHALGTDVRVLAPAGGTTGAQLAADLAARGIAADLVPDAAETRRTIAVVDDAGEATMLNEPARLSDWAGFHSRAAELIPQADVVVVSGSLPDGVPGTAVAQVVDLARDAGRPIVVDTSGPALLAALTAGPTIVKPNADELATAAPGLEPPMAAAQLAQRHGTTVVASLGADGLIAAETTGRLWQARPAARLQGNPTGAGDAVVAALALGLLDRHPIADTLVTAVALSAAAVLQPHAGEIDPADGTRQQDGIVVNEIEGGRWA